MGEFTWVYVFIIGFLGILLSLAFVSYYLSYKACLKEDLYFSLSLTCYELVGSRIVTYEIEDVGLFQYKVNKNPTIPS